MKRSSADFVRRLPDFVEAVRRWESDQSVPRPSVAAARDTEDRAWATALAWWAAGRLDGVPAERIRIACEEVAEAVGPLQVRLAYAVEAAVRIARARSHGRGPSRGCDERAIARTMAQLLISGGPVVAELASSVLASNLIGDRPTMLWTDWDEDSVQELVGRLHDIWTAP